MFIFIREWQKRRVVITKEIISFAFVGEDNQIDYIPLSEVDFVKEMKNAAAQNDNDDGEIDETHKLQIATLPTGYNSGRAYYLATKNRDEFTLLLTQLSKLAKIERKKAEAKTFFGMVQLKVRKRYESSYFQGVMALMIMSVGKTLLPSNTGIFVATRLSHSLLEYAFVVTTIVAIQTD